MKTKHIALAALAALVLCACESTRIEPYRPSGDGGKVTPSVTPTERTDWSVSYIGRTDYQETDGSISRVEEFRFGYTGDKLFILRTYNAADFADWFGGDVATMIRKQAEDLRSAAQREGVGIADLSDVYDKTIKTLFADVMVHGSYTAYLIELDAAGTPTFNYCSKAITIVSDPATDEYNAWLGLWTVSDGYVGYDIQVSAIENNHIYRVDGWETGRAAGDVQMDEEDDWLETRFIAEDGSLSFFIQFIAQYPAYEQLGKVDYMFVGCYVESEGEKVDDTEGREVAWAELTSDGTATMKAASHVFTYNGKQREIPFNTMRYSLYRYADNLWYHFHDILPEFPIAMVKAKGPVALPDRTPVHTENYLRRTQPRTHVQRAR